MFSRRPDRPKDGPRPAASARPTELVPVPPFERSPAVWGSQSVPAGPSGGGGTAAVTGEATVIAERDHVEGTLRSGQGVLVLGSFSGSIESETWVRMGESSRVQADVVADEVVVAGRYAGPLIARSRLEIAATGHLLGEIEAPRVQLHEGGVIDGALYMTTHAADRRAAQGGREGGAGPTSVRGQGASSRSRSARGTLADGSPVAASANPPADRVGAPAPAAPLDAPTSPARPSPSVGASRRP